MAMTTKTRRKLDITSTHQYLGRPIPVDIEENDGEGNARLKLSGQWARISAIENLWEIDGYWQEDQPVIRMYFRVTAEDGRQFLIFRDLVEGAWYRQLTLSD
jgi:hypothetical protein